MISSLASVLRSPARSSFRWFVGLPMDADVWHPTAFTHNRDRLMERMSRMSFWQRFWRCHRSRSFCRASTFRSTAR
jgi:hypothetical protein